MGLVDVLVEVFKKNLLAVIEKEKNKKRFLRQTVLGCRFRAFCGFLITFKIALPEMVSIGSYAIAMHRMEKHDEDRLKTVAREAKKMDKKTLRVVNESKNSPWMA